jgi:NAD(P)-dependent dehydrogenase (short-subunit alcohol dehydrogenase family)
MQRTVLISGASSGLGRAVAEFLQRQGCTVIGISSDAEKLTSALRGLQHAHALRCDITRHEDLSALVRELRARQLTPDAIVNAAAVLGPVAKFGSGDFAAWQRAVEVDLIGNAALLHALLPLLLTAKARPKIINFGGGGAAYARPYHSAYAAAKTGMVRLTEVLALEHPELDCNIIAPGAHKTAMWDGETHDKEPTQWADKQLLFKLVAWLLSPASDHISGKFIHIENPYETFTKDLGPDRYVLRRTA